MSSSPPAGSAASSPPPHEITYDIEYAPVPVIVLRYARYLLTLSTARPELRLATVDALDLALAKHEASKETP